MAYTAADVKKLREETGAPMMDCKVALDEADGDYEKAKQILREKGKAAASKRADRSTGAGVVALALTEDKKTLGGVLLESETDFVARNEDFIEIAQQIAEIFRDNAITGDPMDVKSNGKTVKEIVEDAVAKIRENIKVAQAVHATATGGFVTYVHHDKTKGSAVMLSVPPTEELRKVAVQIVSLPPEVVSKEQLSQEKISQEIETETQRAINEGKDEKIARNIATGRVNKEFVKQVVLLEQPMYLDQSKTVGTYIAEANKDAKVEGFYYFAVGTGA